MSQKERKNYTNTLRVDLVKDLKILAIRMDKRTNELLEEAIEDLLKKHRRKKK